MRKGIFTILLSFVTLALCAQQRPYLQCSDKLEHPYGLTSEITRQSGEYNSLDESLRLMKGIGVNMLRIPMSWDNFSTAEGRFVYKIYDTVTESLKTSPFQTMGIISHNFGKGKDAWKTPGEFAAYVLGMMTRYRNAVGCWEVIPGMDGIWTGGSPLQPAQYFSTLKGVCSVARKTNNKVVLGTPSELKSKFLDSLLAYGGHNYFDVMSFSSYGYPADIPMQVMRIRRMMYKYGFSKPVWLTNLYYGSYMSSDIPLDFWRGAVPGALKALGHKSGSLNVAVVISRTKKGKDALNPYEIDKYLSGLYKSVRSVTADSVGSLSPEDVQVLIPGEEVDAKDLERYVREGGTIILDSPRLPEITHCWVRRAGGARYLTEENLSVEDEMVPLLYDSTSKGGEEDIVAALYKIRSDGSRGNAVILSRKDVPVYIDQEAEQAKRLPRVHILAFACGVDKVFWNGMRSREKEPGRKRDWSGLYHSDLSPKPSSLSYRTLTSMLPAGSSRPEYECLDGVYLAAWNTPEGKKIWAVWTEGDRPLKADLEISGKAKYTGYLGNRMKAITEITDGIVYISEADSVSLK